MISTDNLHTQYVTDAKGHQTAVIIPLSEFNELMEDIDDLASAAERADEPTISHASVVKELKEDGYLSD